MRRSLAQLRAKGKPHWRPSQICVVLLKHFLLMNSRGMMGRKSKIEWTDATWNPIRGCSRVSEGCRNCYAELMAARFSGPGQAYEGLAEMTPAGPRWTGKIVLVEKHLEDPLRWKKPRKIFVNSMSDLFHEDIPPSVIAKIFAVMAAAPEHTFQLLTKRPERMQDLLAWDEFPNIVRQESVAFTWDYDGDWPLPNVWLGVSCEDQRAADRRIPLLLKTPAEIRFVSAEPLLGKIDIFDSCCPRPIQVPLGTTPPLGNLHWIIAGGESGRGARPIHPDWLRSLRDQCEYAGVPFFFKQWGEFGLRRTWGDHGRTKHIFEDGYIVERVGKKKSGRVLDGVTYSQFPS